RDGGVALHPHLRARREVFRPDEIFSIFSEGRSRGGESHAEGIPAHWALRRQMRTRSTSRRPGAPPSEARANAIPHSTTDLRSPTPCKEFVFRSRSCPSARTSTMSPRHSIRRSVH